MFCTSCLGFLEMLLLYSSFCLQRNYISLSPALFLVLVLLFLIILFLNFLILFILENAYFYLNYWLNYGLQFVDRITFKRIIKSKSTEQFSGVPYVMTLLNCLLSAWYGLPFVSKNNILVSTINGTGSVIESIYVLVFILYATRKEKGKILGLLTLVLTIFATVAFVSLFALHGSTRKLFCGLAATVFSIIMYASPLSIIRLVIKTKSVEFMPFFLSLFVFLCGTSWFVYGLLGHDPFVAVPNGFGCGLGTVQLILYFIYRNGKGVDDSDDVKKPTSQSVEMGVGKPQLEKNQVMVNGSHDEQV
ncbi:bidirectional sugar transporter SWEET1 isoform X1 [Jatropha curcas]|uniref:bidirectional sugar transporter SWEET1 isoform X1 n=1 Tax=Jatropha curcas TaxID=180498 RepID=UPI0005FAA0A0|nr:bidirectional sugar transporter SWEET1 isoform X1 [Jatropha curcas]